MWRPLWNNCGNTAALRAEWTVALLSGHHQTTVPAAFSSGPSSCFKVFTAVFASVKRHKFFEQTFFFVRCLNGVWYLFIGWYWIKSSIAFYPWWLFASSFFLFVAVALLMRRGSTLSESLQKCIPLFEMHLSNNDPNKTSCVFLSFRSDTQQWWSSFWCFGLFWVLPVEPVWDIKSV